MTVRLAGAGDADAIGRVQVETWRAAYTGLMPDEAVAGFDVESRQRQWREWLGAAPRPGGATFVVEDGGEVVGFASVGASWDEEAEAEARAVFDLPAPVVLGSRDRAGAAAAGGGVDAVVGLSPCGSSG